MAFWKAEKPLVLASRSAARHAILRAAEIPCELHPADVDERALERAAGPVSADVIAGCLADAKAVAVARRFADRLVLGADQTLGFKGRAFSKPADRNAARLQLSALRGETHELHSAIAVYEGPAKLFSQVVTARLTFRSFSDTFLESYLDAAGVDATASVGGYQLESLGIHLFERIEGDYFTILGLPLLPLLMFLRRAGYVAA